MKTSNKILIGLALFIYAVPLTQSFILKRKFENGEYVIDKNKGFNVQGLSQRALPVGEYSAVKFEGFGSLKITLTPEQDDYFSYENWWDHNDSVKVSLADDTLKVRFTNSELEAALAGGEIQGGRNYHNHVSLRFPAMAMKKMIFDGATMLIPNGHFDQAMSVYATSDLSKLELGAENGADSLWLNHLEVNTTRGETIVHNNTRVNTLQLNIGNGARFQVNKARVNKVAGSVGDDAVIDAPVSFLRQLLK